MICPQCGANNDDNAYQCTQCWTVIPRTPPTLPALPAQDALTQPPPVSQPPVYTPPSVPPPYQPNSVTHAYPTYDQSEYASVKIPNYLPQAILTALFCCQPLGIVAIVYAAQVNSKLAAGDIAGARNASNKAKSWCWLAFSSLFIAYAVIAIIVFLTK